MIIGEDVIKYYQHFYIKKYGNDSYVFKPSTKALVQIEAFLINLHSEYKLETLGPVFLSRYFSFQFKRIEGQNFKRFSSVKGDDGKVQIYDIIGKKAYEYWINRDKEFDFTMKLNLNLIINKHIDTLSKAEEIEKKRFFNTDTGIANCLMRTTLYNHKSTSCILCIHKLDCKKILKVNYPQIYKHRNYDRPVSR